MIWYKSVSGIVCLVSWLSTTAWLWLKLLDKLPESAWTTVSFFLFLVGALLSGYAFFASENMKAKKASEMLKSVTDASSALKAAATSAAVMRAKPTTGKLQ